MSALAKTGSAAVDLSRLSDVATTSKTLKIGDEVVDLSQTTALLKDDALYKTVLDNPDVIKFLNEADPKDLKEALGGINDTNKLQEIGKKLDKKTLDALKNVDGGADLVKKLDPSSAKKLNLAQQAKNAATAFTKASAAKLNKATKSIRKFISGAPNKPTPANVPKAADELVPPGGAANASGEEVGENLARSRGGNAGDATEAVENTANVLKDGSESSKSLRKGLAELGITPGSVAIGAGVIVLLCMAYDTDNPFTAVDRALDDTGKVVKGFKEVADSAATAVKDTAEGGFDFISFVTKNSWISFACSILCVILLFALFMTGMLGSMGGNNRR
tara:strand:+ start:11928 stop:12926 length:999 start_codon:yes stop_codon:yes gene_type:complete